MTWKDLSLRESDGNQRSKPPSFSGSLVGGVMDQVTGEKGTRTGKAWYGLSYGGGCCLGGVVLVAFKREHKGLG